ncbi:hypothetical protein AB0E85_33825 [Streptomyces sp. NPDC029044]|uniref:antibiotic biosynthesis monooxygenase family protein n=1 Tax=Streptomyces sp. NPDC029044 TaxID=3157198 RepID=UPI0033F35EF6
MLKRAADQPGFPGGDSARGADGPGVTMSYRREGESTEAWRNHAEHTPARERGREHRYASFALRGA